MYPELTQRWPGHGYAPEVPGKGWDTQATLGSGHFLAYMEASWYVTLWKCIPSRDLPHLRRGRGRCFCSQITGGENSGSERYRICKCF